MKLNGANPNVLIIGREYACMHFAVGMENEIFAEKSTQLLLEYGGDPNVVTNEGLTPFHVAASAGRAEIVELLLVSNCNNIITEIAVHKDFYFQNLILSVFYSYFIQSISIFSKYSHF